MASWNHPSPLLLASSSSIPRLLLHNRSNLRSLRRNPRCMSITVSISQPSEDPVQKQRTKLVVFLGKGGSGKTTAAIFAAQHYAMAGLKTCLVIHSQDRTADYILNCKIGTSPVTCNNNLSAVRLETTKMILEPLSRLKEADARLNLTQGVLEGVVGEELGVLPGMDSIFSALALEKLVGFFRDGTQKNIQNDNFDIIVYDGVSTEETLRMIGATGKSRLYLKYLRNLAEKTDLGRLTGPSLLRLAEESLNFGGSSSNLNGKSSGEIWNKLEQTLEKGSSFIEKPDLFGCYLVMDPNSTTSLNTALRYWGCAIQAGAYVSGAFGITFPNSNEQSVKTVKDNLLPLPFALLPYLEVGNPLKWNDIMNSNHSTDARGLLGFSRSDKSPLVHPVIFDSANKSVTLLMPGFDKSEIKLYQYRGGSELLVEAGDQRRVIRLPTKIQGKVGGAKFVDRNLIVTMR